MLYNYLVVMDFETTRLDREACEVWQIGATVIRPRDLQIFDDHFNVKMSVERPEDADPESLAISHTTIDEVQANGIDPQEGWNQFARWVNQWNLGGKPDLFSCPVMAGHNILNYDLPIYERYAYKYGFTKKDKKLGKEVPGLFNRFRHYDTVQMMGMWTENLKEPHSLSLVNLRKYFGMPASSIEHAHDALQDVRDTAKILVKLLRLSRSIAPKVKFKGCFDDEVS